MTEPVAVRCPGCGVLTANDTAACRSCGTLLPRRSATGAGPAAPDAVPLAGPAQHPSLDAVQATERAQARVIEVVRLFVGLLVLVIGMRVASACGARDAHLDVAVTGILAAIAFACTMAARTEIGPLLVRTGGWRGALAAAIGFAVLVAFGAIYFPTLRYLGFPVERITDTYSEMGWPPWTAYLLVSIAPGVIEELTFRGYVMARLDHLLTARETLLVQAGLFALMHLGVVIFPSHFVIGLVLGTIRRRTGSLYPGMAVHMTWNGLILWAEMTGQHFL